MLQEIVLLLDAAALEAFSDALLERGALSVSVEDALADSDQEDPLYGEPGLEPARLAWQSNRLRVLLPAGDDPVQLVAGAAAALNLAVPVIESRRAVEDADWVRLTQAQFPPVQLSERLWIVPSWHEVPDPAALNIRLDPGVAFGTGSHPTTRLCLQWLAQTELAGKSVLDYGCGSGVLAIAAAKLGAREVFGTDIDPQALDAARANSELNQVSARYTLPHELPEARFDVVLANILANPLRVLAPALLARVAPGGALVLAGLLNWQADDLLACYREVDAGVALRSWRDDEGWTCLAGFRAASR
jgi:ribosomal protein L11 methyltransferase